MASIKSLYNVEQLIIEVAKVEFLWRNNHPDFCKKKQRRAAFDLIARKIVTGFQGESDPVKKDIVTHLMKRFGILKTTYLAQFKGGRPIGANRFQELLKFLSEDLLATTSRATPLHNLRNGREYGEFSTPVYTPQSWLYQNSPIGGSAVSRSGPTPQFYTPIREQGMGMSDRWMQNRPPSGIKGSEAKRRRMGNVPQNANVNTSAGFWTPQASTVQVTTPVRVPQYPNDHEGNSRTQQTPPSVKVEGESSGFSLNFYTESRTPVSERRSQVTFTPNEHARLSTASYTPKSRTFRRGREASSSYGRLTQPCTPSGVQGMVASERLSKRNPQPADVGMRTPGGNSTVHVITPTGRVPQYLNDQEGPSRNSRTQQTPVSVKVEGESSRFSLSYYTEYRTPVSERRSQVTLKPKEHVGLSTPYTTQGRTLGRSREASTPSYGRLTQPCTPSGVQGMVASEHLPQPADVGMRTPGGNRVVSMPGSAPTGNRTVSHSSTRVIGEGILTPRQMITSELPSTSRDAQLSRARIMSSNKSATKISLDSIRGRKARTQYEPKAPMNLHPLGAATTVMGAQSSRSTTSLNQNTVTPEPSRHRSVNAGSASIVAPSTVPDFRNDPNLNFYVQVRNAMATMGSSSKIKFKQAVKDLIPKFLG